MVKKVTPVEISGVGSHQIDLEILDHAVRERLVECIHKNGKISIMIGKGLVAEGPDGGFAQSVD